MQGPKHLFESEDRWVTRMGAWFSGERVVFRGKDLFHDLKDLGWMQLLLYGITGRIFDEKQVRLFEAFWTVCTSYPDPRLWNNRVAAFAGTVRSTTALAIGASTAVSEASIYGRRPDLRAIDFLFRAKEGLGKGLALVDIVKTELEELKKYRGKYRGIPGYGRPVTRKDERIAPIMALADELGFSDGPFVKLAFSIEDILLNGRLHLHMNIAAVLAALAADQGLSREEYYQYMILSFSAGMIPCYSDARNKSEGAFFPLRCERVHYEGTPRRVWVDRRQKTDG